MNFPFRPVIERKGNRPGLPLAIDYVTRTTRAKQIGALDVVVRRRSLRRGGAGLARRLQAEALPMPNKTNPSIADVTLSCLGRCDISSEASSLRQP